ncbi:MAG: membrane protein insertase YidC [Rhodospirillales bacterium]|nr:membrane protein insertase YidC [Rhodospirillales bacterium]
MAEQNPLPTPPNNPLKKDQMHPDDLRNMFIFFILAAILYFAYDTYVLKPQREAIQHRAQIEAEIKQALGPGALQEAKPAPPKDRAEVITEGGRIKIRNSEIRGSMDLSGGSLDDISLGKYFETLEKKDNVAVLNPRLTAFPRSVEYGWVASGQNIAVPKKSTNWQIRGNSDLAPGKPVTMIWDNGQGVIFERRLELDEHFMFTVTQRAINNSGRNITLYPYGLVSQKGMPPTFQGTWISYEGPIGFIGEELFNDSYNDMRKNKKAVKTANQGWLGFTDKYWLTALIPPQGQEVKYSYSYAGPEKDKDNEGLYQADFLGAALELKPGQSGEVQSKLFVGAKRVLLLQQYEKDLNIPQFDLAVDFGWFWFMTKPFFYLLHYLHHWIGNMGVAIIIMTIMIRGAVFPLTNTSYRSFAKMKKVAPLVTELREKYGEDKQKLQQELIEMYQREGVNPMSGCLPILVQIPIFFALYKTFFVTIEMRHEPFFGWIQDLSAADPTSIFNLFGLIPWTPPDFLIIGVWPCLMLVAMIIQKKLNPPPQDPLQRDMANYMPFLFAFIMSKFAAGLVVYWTFSAFIGVIQQMIIMKSLGVPIHLFGETAEDKKLEAAIDKGPALHPLAEMAEDEVEEALGLDNKDRYDMSGMFDDKDKPQKPKKSKKKK